MRYHHERILFGTVVASLVASMVGVVISFLVFDAPVAQATPGQVMFGGIITADIPPVPPPLPPCPAHFVVANMAPVGPKIVGIYILPGSRLYPYANHLISRFVLGEYAPVPFPTCTFPYPVFPLFMDGTN